MEVKTTKNIILGSDHDNWEGGEREEGKTECLFIIFPKITP